MKELFKRIMGILLMLCVLGVVGIVALWLMWSSITVYVRPGMMGVVNKKTGHRLPEGQILAAEGEKGVQAAVLGEGRYFINPVTTTVEIKPCYMIPPGKIGVVTSKVGKDPAGATGSENILANDDEKGIWRRVLTPGLHRLNPYGYTVEIKDAVVITPGYVGMMTALLGKPTTNRFAGAAEKGLRHEILQPGMYYVNPYEVKVIAVEIGINQVTFAPPVATARARTLNAPGQAGGYNNIAVTNAAVRGYSSSPQEENRGFLYASSSGSDYAASAGSDTEQRQEAQYKARSSNWARWLGDSYSTRQKEESAEVMRRNAMNQIGQQGVEVNATVVKDKAGKAQQTAQGRPMPEAISFPSKDGFPITLDATIEWELLPKDVAEVVAEFGDVAAVEDKIIIPQSQSIGRLQGSTFKAKDLLLGEEREKFQEVFRKTMSDIGLAKNIVIHSAFIRNVLLPQALLLPIRERYISVEKEQTARMWQATRQKAAELQRETSLIAQRTREVEAKTIALINVIEAEKQRLSEQIAASTRKLVAGKQMEIAALDAQRTVALGEAQANVTQWKGEAEGKGMSLKVAAMGSADAYTRYQVAQRLDPNMKIRVVHTGNGTLWTDLEKTVGAAAAGTVLKSKEEPKQ